MGLGSRSYEVTVGEGAAAELKQAVAGVGAAQAVVVTQAGLDIKVDSGLRQTTLHVGSGEGAKNLNTVEELCRGFARAGLTRRDVVIGLGGGVVTDTAGFAAASYHRGTPVIHLPTTLLGQVDAAIGGKTGVNLPEGKNLVGAFWQPAAVLCDTAFLTTLPEREWRSGLGEVAKCELLGADVSSDSSPEEMVAACVRLKAEIVTDDERETSGRRDLLNYGHTLGHALETVGRYDLRHGEAVAVGLAFAAYLACHLERIDAERQTGIVRTVEGYGLRVTAPTGFDLDEILEVMSRDKKARGVQRFVLDGPAGVEPVEVAAADVRAALIGFAKLSP